ncbi:hypothetical protein ZEAMMB73_Zm00001d034157 [Zea mays]|uniref:Uncharacterized protein n=1 Tax=Zea mays TaxID=4577 RepID=A0A1D6L5T9_MAIZE|nr:hypothetical protein ZEAMMB73_Zm00001d034157 [Zea mays]
MLPTCASGIACPMLSATIKAKLYQPMSCMSMHDGRYLWFFNFMVVWPSRHPPAQTRYSSTTAAGGGDVAKGWQVFLGWLFNRAPSTFRVNLRIQEYFTSFKSRL